MDIRIDNYRNDDFLRLRKLLNDNYGSTIDEETLEKEYLGDGRIIIVARDDDGAVCGCAFLEVKEDHVRPSTVLFVSYVAVDEQYRRHGVGKALMQRVYQLAQELKCNAVELTSADYREGAHVFYKSLGFTRKKTTVFIREVQ